MSFSNRDKKEWLDSVIPEIQPELETIRVKLESKGLKCPIILSVVIKDDTGISASLWDQTPMKLNPVTPEIEGGW